MKECRQSYSLMTTVTVKNRNYLSRQLAGSGLVSAGGRLNTSSLSISQMEELEQWRDDTVWDAVLATFGRQSRSWRARRLLMGDEFYGRSRTASLHDHPVLRSAGVMKGVELPTLFGGDLRELMRWVAMAGLYTKKYRQAAVLHRAIALSIGPARRR